jgi:hypothetical protein
MKKTFNDTKKELLGEIVLTIEQEFNNLIDGFEKWVKNPTGSGFIDVEFKTREKLVKAGQKFIQRIISSVGTGY